MLFTVFTPTYNRVGTLRRLFDSLRRQTFTDFEWVVVDDGSTDGTRELVQGFQAEATFPVRYFWQKNQHKKAAINRGVREALGELFLIIDSDDELLPTALERFAFHWNAIPDAERPRFSAVTCLCQTPEGQDVGSRFPRGPQGDWCDSNSLEMRLQHRVTGEKCGFHRTSVMRQFPFPEEIPGLVSEAIVWWPIAAAGWKTRFVNERVRVYHRPADGDNLTTRDMSLHAPGISYFYKTTIPFVLPYLRSSPGPVFRHFAAMTAWSMMNKQSPTALLLESKSLLGFALTAAALPVGGARVGASWLARAARRVRTAASSS